MAPPAYSDLGKQARDVFTKNYNFSFVKLDCKTKTSGGMEFAMSGSSNTDSGKVVSSLESKYKIPEHGILLKEKWSTDNILTTEISIEDKPIKGTKLSILGTFVPNTGKKSATIKNSMKMENINVNVDFDVDMKTPILHAASVMGLRGWLVGAQTSFDAAKGKCIRSNFAVGYATDDFVLHTNVNDGQEFGGSVYQKVNDNLETGVQLAWAAGNNATSFGLGCVYSIDKDTSLRVSFSMPLDDPLKYQRNSECKFKIGYFRLSISSKPNMSNFLQMTRDYAAQLQDKINVLKKCPNAKINNSSQIGLGIAHRLREGPSGGFQLPYGLQKHGTDSGIQLTLSAMIDGRSFNQGGHKLGLGLDFEA